MKGVVNRIEDIANQFVEDFSYRDNDKVILNGFCFTLCYPLSIYLNGRGFSFEIKGGYYDSQPHFWLYERNTRKILDPTICQFSNMPPNVIKWTYFGEWLNVYEERTMELKAVRDAWMKNLSSCTIRMGGVGYDGPLVRESLFRSACFVLAALRCDEVNESALTFANDIKELLSYESQVNSQVVLKTKESLEKFSANKKAHSNGTGFLS